MQTLVIGARAVGALFGSAWRVRAPRFPFVCRSDYDAVEREGMTSRVRSWAIIAADRIACIAKRPSAMRRRTTPS